MLTSSLAQKISTVCGVVALAFLVIFPLIITPSVAGAFITAKTVVFVLGVSLLAVAAALLPSAARKRSAVTYAYVALIAIFLISALLGPSFLSSFFGSFYRLDGLFLWCFMGLLAFGLINFLRTSNAWLHFFRAVFLVGVLVALSAIFEPWVPGLKEYVALAGVRRVGFIGQPIFLAAYLTSMLAIGALIFLRAPRPLARTPVAVGGIICLIAIFLTGSRGPILGLAAGLMAFVLLLPQAVLPSRRKAAWGAVGAIVVAMIFAVTILPKLTLVPPTIRRGLDFTAFSQSITAGTRLILWRAAYEAAVTKPVLGYGFGQFSRAWEAHFDPSIIKFSAGETIQDKAHNWYVELAATTGFLGLVAYLIFLGSLGALLFQLWRTRPKERVVVCVGAFVLTSFIVQGFFAFDSLPTLFPITIIFSYLFWKSATPQTASPVARRFKIVCMIAIFLVSILLGQRVLAAAYHAEAARRNTVKPAVWYEHAAASAEVNTPYALEFAETSAKQLVQMYLSGVVGGREEFLRLAEPARVVLQNASRRDPENSYTHFILGQLLATGGQMGNAGWLQDGLIELKAAYELTPRRQYYAFVLGQALLSAEKSAEAIALLEQVVAAEPTTPDGHWFLGLAYAISGDTKRAQEEIVRALKFGRVVTNQEAISYLEELFGKPFSEIKKDALADAPSAR